MGIPGLCMHLASVQLSYATWMWAGSLLKATPMQYGFAKPTAHHLKQQRPVMPSKPSAAQHPKAAQRCSIANAHSSVSHQPQRGKAGTSIHAVDTQRTCRSPGGPTPSAQQPRAWRSAVNHHPLGTKQQPAMHGTPSPVQHPKQPRNAAAPMQRTDIFHTSLHKEQQPHAVPTGGPLVRCTRCTTTAAPTGRGEGAGGSRLWFWLA